MKIWIRLGLLLFCRKIIFNNPAILKRKGPLLLACNHPNSFLDALIVGSYFKRPVHFLTRGDAFRKPLVKKILTALNMIPIYRLSEGREHLALNDATFEKCGDILSGGGIVLIFAEGLCVNQWALRPLKKGAARIAWNVLTVHGIQDELNIVPVGINYSGFIEPGKMIEGETLAVLKLR
ncbi:MAG: 1-acyl-sn-glycerol-3-phosphate acyltransferase [Flavitalea sp.]